MKKFLLFILLLPFAIFAQNSIEVTTSGGASGGYTEEQIGQIAYNVLDTSTFSSISMDTATATTLILNGSDISNLLLFDTLSIDFTVGVTNAIDTNAFDTDNFYNVFYHEQDTMVIIGLRVVLQGTSPSVTLQMNWHSTLGSGSAVVLNTVAPTITSTTTGDTDTNFDNTEIPGGVYVWFTTPTVTTKPTSMSVHILYYLK